MSIVLPLVQTGKTALEGEGILSAIDNSLISQEVLNNI
jgi:hypothetical protein